MVALSVKESIYDLHQNRAFNAAVKEICYMGILLRFCDAQRFKPNFERYSLMYCPDSAVDTNGACTLASY